MSSVSSSADTSPMFAPILENRVSDPANFGSPSPASPDLMDTCDQLIRNQVPNLFRLYLNPWVAQTCVCLSRLVQTLWPTTRLCERYPSFLANSGDEALSGAIKLARYHLNSRNHSSSRPEKVAVGRVWLLSEEDQFAHFASTKFTPRDRSVLNADLLDKEAVPVNFIPDVSCVTSEQWLDQMLGQIPEQGTLVVTASLLASADESLLQSIDMFHNSPDSMLIVFVDAECLPSLVNSDKPCFAAAKRLTPRIVVFDETMTRRDVPFGAFSAHPDLYSKWSRRKMATFHSTTYQPNSISTLHFVRCLKYLLPEFMQRLKPELDALLQDRQQLKKTFSQLYSAGLARMISITGFDQDGVTASGHYVKVGHRNCFDGVGGVACSLRGHNPKGWVGEIQQFQELPDCRAELTARLQTLTGLEHHVPAVSGGSAVEHALKLALTAQFPKNYVLALKGGFGGKTLLALSGTSHEFYKQHLAPLYAEVIYVDPFDSDAVEQIERLLDEFPVAVMQLELIQGVGGVREIPADVIRCLNHARQKNDFLLFVDEIQTGMFRTGPFVRSTELQISPDLLAVGKGTSDMMFSFALTLYTERLHQKLHRQGSSLARDLQHRYGYLTGYRALCNTLRRDQIEQIGERVAESGRLLEQTLRRELADCSLVREIRSFGLLVGIELDLRRTLVQRLGLNAVQLYLLQMLRNANFPVLMGYCQYEPRILKLTPPLDVTADEIRLISQTIGKTLRTSQARLMATAISSICGAGIRRRL